MYSSRRSVLGSGAGKAAADILKRRIAGESLYCILGKADFMGMEFKVTRDVLAPRPDTEILVETAVRLLKGRPVEILEIGAGSGCVAVSLAAILPRAAVTAVDISSAALEVAESNAAAHGVLDRVRFFQSDLFPPGPGWQERFDCVLSNPPYIRSADIEGLSPEVRNEPRLALDGGLDGLDFYRRIISGCAGYLKKKGLLLFETGYDQSCSVAGLVRDSKIYSVKEVIRDYNNIQRVIVSYKG